MFEKFNDIFIEREKIDHETPDWDYAIEKCWKREIEIFCDNIEETIKFLDTQCTAEEFSWLSEVFEEIAEKTQSKEFINCLFRVAEKYPEETKKYNILFFIETAKNLIIDN